VAKGTIRRLTEMCESVSRDFGLGALAPAVMIFSAELGLFLAK
jgi:hypothetical protein